MTSTSGSRKVLVTGGGGFIGSRLVRTLVGGGARVRVLDVHLGHLKGAADGKVEVVGLGGDYLRGGMVDKRLVRRAVRDVDVVYHLALNWNGASWRHRLPLVDLLDANVRGALNLLETAAASKVKHFLVASSAAVYGEVEAPRLDEETVCKPEVWDGDPGAGYGILKLIVEKLCLMYGRQHRLPVTAFRIDYVLKEGERPDGGGVHVADVVRAFLLAARNRKAYGQVFNLSSGGGDVSIRKVRRVLGWEPRQTRSLITPARSGAR